MSPKSSKKKRASEPRPSRFSLARSTTLENAAWSAIWCGLAISTLDVLLALGVFPAGAASLSQLFWDAARLHLLAAALVAPLAALLVSGIRRGAQELGASDTLFGMLAVLSGTAAGGIFERALDRKKLELPEILSAHEWGVLVAAGAGALLTFWVARKTLKKPLEKLPSKALVRGAVLSVVSLVVALGLWLSHRAAAPAYLHQIAGATGAGMTLFAATALLLGGWVAPRSWARFLPLGLVGIMLLTLPLSRAGAARFTLFGHVPIAGAYGVYFRRLTDWDSDGATATYLGGSDCAPFDRAVSPLAREIPGDGIDQDCRGGDAKKGIVTRGAPLLPECRVDADRIDNIVLLSVDALRADALRPEITPNLIDLGRQSSVFARAYAPSGSTEGSTLSLVTGKTLSDLRKSISPRSYALDPADHFVPRLVDAGFRAAVFIPFGVPDFVRTGAQLHRPRWLDIQPHNVKELTASASLLGGTVPLLEPAPQVRGTFVWLHIPDLHAPYPQAMLGRPDVSDYEQTLIYVDANIGLFLNSLHNAGTLEKTVLIVTSDHGEQLGQRGREGHGTLLFEEGVRVPLIIYVPGCRGERVTAPVSLLGLEEFIRRLSTGSAAPAENVAGATPIVVEETGISALGLKRAVIGPRYKLIVDPMNGGAMAFDLDEDPGEFTDISESQPQALSELWKFYQRWLDSTVR